MSACRLNNLLLMHVHQDRTDDLDLLEIAKQFIHANSRRIRYFDYSQYHIIAIAVHFVSNTLHSYS